MDYVIQDCWTMISQDLVDIAIGVIFSFSDPHWHHQC